MRKFTSLTALLSFIVTIITSVVLYIAPQGRIAYWADWRLWGLTKDQWGDLHITIGTLFLLALLLHAYYNWKPIKAYLSQSRRLVVVTPAAVAASFIVIVVGLGTYFKVAPFSSFLEVADHLKLQAAVTYGEPPYGHAELSSLRSLAPKIGLAPAQLIEALKKAGYTEAEEAMTLLELARRHNVAPQQVYRAALPQSAANLPETAPAGTGSMALADFCAAHELMVENILQALENAGLTARADMTIKAIAQANGKDPHEVYAVIRQAAGKP